MDEYCDEVNGILEERFGISLNDVDIFVVEQAYIDGESPEELVDRIQTKYDLIKINDQI